MSLETNYYPPLNTVSNLTNLYATSQTYEFNASAKNWGALGVLLIGTVATIALAILASPLTAIFAALGTVSLAIGLLMWSAKDSSEVKNIDVLFRTANTDEATYNQIQRYDTWDYSLRTLIKVEKNHETHGYYFITRRKEDGAFRIDEIKNSDLTIRPKK